jgi:calcium-dependent protein kinase
LQDDCVVKEATEMFKNADLDGNGEIDYTEWEVATINKYNVLQSKKIEAAFALFDRDGSGSIEAKELKEVLGAGKKFGNETIWNEIIQEVD